MDSKKTADNHQSSQRDETEEYGECGFVFTEYDRGARSEQSQEQSRNQDDSQPEKY